MVRRFHDFHVVLIGSPPGDSQPGGNQGLFVLSVEFVPVPVPFADFRRAVGLVRKRARLKLARPRAQAHRAAHLFHAQQLSQLVNHAVRGLRIKFRAVRLLQPRRIARVFDRGALHSEANSKEGNSLFQEPGSRHTP